MKRVKTVEAFDKMQIRDTKPDEVDVLDTESRKYISGNGNSSEKNLEVTMGISSNPTSNTNNTVNNNKSSSKYLGQFESKSIENYSEIANYDSNSNKQESNTESLPRNTTPESDVIVDKEILEGLLDENQNLKDEASKNKVV